MRLYQFVLVLLAISIPSLASSTAKAPIYSTSIQFYSTSLDLRYDPSMLKKNRHCTSTFCIKRFYKKLEESDYQLLLDDLLKHKEALKLNDWFYYNLVRKAINQIYVDKRDMFRTTAVWFIMTKSGYDTRLYTSKNKFTFLYVRTEDKVFEAPFVKIKKRPYVNLTAMYYGINTRGIYFEIPRYQPGQLNDKPFSFKIEHFPDLPPMLIEREYKFKMEKEEIVLNVDVDTLGKTLLKGFPITLPMNYIEVPLSQTTMASLKKALNPHLIDKSPTDKIRTLVSFTRKAFPYKSDQVKYRRDQPLTADQLMLADSSDFEDRCALFYSLLKETTDLNFIVIQYTYDDIITIGVELPELVGKPFEYEGIQYTICDPTMPSNSSKVGLYPINLDKDIEILEIVHHSD